MGRTRPPANMRTFLTLCLATSALAQTRLERGEIVEVVKPQEEPSFFARIVGDEGTARIVESTLSARCTRPERQCQVFPTWSCLSPMPRSASWLLNNSVTPSRWTQSPGLPSSAEPQDLVIGWSARCSTESSGRSLTGWLGLRSSWVMWSTLCQHLSARSLTSGSANCLPNINQLKLYCIRNATFFHVIIISI